VGLLVREIEGDQRRRTSRVLKIRIAAHVEGDPSSAIERAITVSAAQAR
jgi:hypothetical protein